jgi:hypothetical protein
MTTMPLASLTLCALSAVAGLVAVPHVGAPLLGRHGSPLRRHEQGHQAVSVSLSVSIMTASHFRLKMVPSHRAWTWARPPPAALAAAGAR